MTDNTTETTEDTTQGQGTTEESESNTTGEDTNLEFPPMPGLN